MRNDRRKELGRQGEQYAREHLSQNGYRIVAQNWRCRTGEIDLVAERDGVLVFVEVRTRRMTGRYGTPQESVDFRKQRQVRETAQMYLYRHRLYDVKVRFDVICVLLSPEGVFSRLDHIHGAF